MKEYIERQWTRNLNAEKNSNLRNEEKLPKESGIKC